MWRPTCLLFAVLLTGCMGDMPKPPPAVTVVCPPIKAYTKAEEQAVAASLASLPAGSPIAAFIADYGALRAAARACANPP